MSTECHPSAASSAAPIEVSPPLNRRRIDRIDEPARPLGPKRAALQIRRQRSTRAAARSTAMGAANQQGEQTLVSSDTSVTITLRATTLGLLVERTQSQPVGARLVQTMVFTDPESFDFWCALEPSRFDDPVLYDQLCREGHEALGGKR